MACGSSKDDTFDADKAMSVADAYFEAYNAGDVDAVLALFSGDATFSTNSGAQPRDDWEQLLVWNAAQGTSLSAPNGRVTEETSDESITVACPHGNLDVLVLTVDGPPVPINQTFVITPDGIREWKFSFGQPDFNTVGVPFARWMEANHPEDAADSLFGSWDSVEEAKQNGILRVRYADEWAAYLEANNCTYRDDC